MEEVSFVGLYESNTIRIKKDYQAMAEIIYGEYPNLEEMIKILQKQEK